MKKIFDVIPADFFKILARENSELLSEAAFLLFKETNDLNFTIDRDDASNLLEDHIDGLNLSNRFETSREYGNRIIRTLIETKWLKQDTDETLRQVLGFYDYTVKFIRFINGLSEPEVVEYSGHLRAISTSLNNVHDEDGYLDLDSAYDNARKFRNRIELLNSNIKDYHQRIFDEEYSDDLNELLKLLTTDYYLEILDKSYHQLITEDHPARYKFSVLDACERILSDEILFMALVNKANPVKGESLDKTRERYRNYIYEIVDLFDNVDNWVEEIKDKNAILIGDTVNRINFMLNNYTDVTAQLNEIAKKLDVIQDDIDIPINLFKVSLLQEDSLRSPMIPKEFILEEIEDHEEIDLSLFEDKFNQIHVESKYSKKQIEEIVMHKLKTVDTIGIMDITSDDEVLAILIFIYAYSFNAQYEVIQSSENLININGTVFTDFKLRKRL